TTCCSSCWRGRSRRTPCGAASPLAAPPRPPPASRPFPRPAGAPRLRPAGAWPQAEQGRGLLRVEGRAEVALAGCGPDDHDQLARVVGPLRHLHGRVHRGPAADAAEDTLLARQPAGHLEGRVVVHLDDLVHDPQVEDTGDEAGADALDLVRA